MIKYWVAFLLCSHFAFADEIRVLFFGGAGTDSAQMEKWHSGMIESLRKSGLKESAYTFREYAYPPKAAEEKKSALKFGNSLIESIILEMNESGNREIQYILVGHSSGSAISNAIASRAQNKGRLTHVVLDGFHPDKLKDQGTTICYTSHSSLDPKLKSPNHPGMVACNPPGDNQRDLSINYCKTEKCLHYTVVNSNPAIGKIRNNDPSAKFYDQIIPFTDWLPKIAVPSEQSASPASP